MQALPVTLILRISCCEAWAAECWPDVAAPFGGSVQVESLCKGLRHQGQARDSPAGVLASCAGLVAGRLAVNLAGRLFGRFTGGLAGSLSWL